ncbi:MAG: DUF4344 domain-containing metallopeptidase [Nitrospiraceae bacterium]
MTTRGFLFFAVIWLMSLALAATVAGADGTFKVKVPAGQWKAVKAANQPKGAIVTVEAKSNGAVAVAFVDSGEYGHFPAVTRPLFQGRVDQHLSFSVTIPSAGDYYVVLDNRTAEEPRAVTVTVRRARGDQARATEDSIEAFQRKLDEFQRNLNQVFVFNPVPLRIKECGAPKAFTTSSAIVLCREYTSMLRETLGDRTKAADAILFTLFHEFGHVLLAQWKYPAYDNEEVADEFATAAMVLLGQKDRVRAKAEYFAAKPSSAEAIAKAFQDDRHPLSAQRARNILRWADDPSLVRKWQTLFVPHLQTPALQQFLQQSAPLMERGLMAQELASRR